MIKFKNTFFGEVKNGELIIQNMGDYSARIHKLEGLQVTLKIEKRKERKTSKDALRERERMKKRYRHNRKKPLPFFLTAKKKYPIAI